MVGFRQVEGSAADEERQAGGRDRRVTARSLWSRSQIQTVYTRGRCDARIRSGFLLAAVAPALRVRDVIG